VIGRALGLGAAARVGWVFVTVSDLLVARG